MGIERAVGAWRAGIGTVCLSAFGERKAGEIR